MNKNNYENFWLKNSLAVAAIFICRMQGIFLLIPVFSSLALNITDATPVLVGLALGMYGLAQACMQIPFGFLSDKYGRINLILIGLSFFIIGSILGIFANNIWLIIIARFLQGLGAIGGVLIALLSDITPESKRTQAMAIIGASIGLSFIIATIFAPILSKNHGLKSIFFTMALLGGCAVTILITLIPRKHTQINQLHLKIENTKKKLWPLNAGIFLQHLILTANFFVMPILLKEYIKLKYLNNLWSFYIPIMIISFALIFPIIKFSEKQKKEYATYKFFIAISAFSQGLLIIFYKNFYMFSVISCLYFIAFNYLEAILPSMVSKIAPKEQKGAAMGIYSTSQFFGIFIGGILSGLLYRSHNSCFIYILNFSLALVWLCISNMPFNYLKNKY